MEGIIIIWHVILFFMGGFAQFNFVLNKGPSSAIIFLTVVCAGVYFLGWWALLTFFAGGVFGGRMAIEQMKKDAAEHAKIQQFTRDNLD